MPAGIAASNGTRAARSDNAVSPAHGFSYAYAEAERTVIVELSDADGVPCERYIFPIEWMMFDRGAMGHLILADLKRRAALYGLEPK